MISEKKLSSIEERATTSAHRPLRLRVVGPDTWEIHKIGPGGEAEFLLARFYHEASAVFFCEALKDIPDLVAEVRRLRGSSKDLS